MRRILRHRLTFGVVFAILLTLVANFVLWLTDWPPFTTRISVSIGGVLALYLVLSWRRKNRPRVAEAPSATEQHA